jgi:hypothetical protein
MTIYQEAATPLVPINLDVLDAEIVAVDDAPGTGVARVAERNLPVRASALDADFGVLADARQSLLEDPYPVLVALKWGLPTAIVGVAIYGAVQVVWWFTEHLAEIGMGAGGVIGAVILLSLLGGGRAVCAGLHCAGCRR